MEKIGWEVDSIGNTYIYIKKIPIIGNFVKIPRIPENTDIQKILKKISFYKPFQIKISPYVFSDNNSPVFFSHLKTHGFKIELSPFNPTTTIIFDLKNSENGLFAGFTSAKRRAVRKAVKNGVIVKKTNDINNFIKIRQTQYTPLGFLVTSEMNALWDTFYPKNTVLFLAYKKNDDKTLKPISGIQLLLYKNICYYWFASSLISGKKLYAPSLLVWEAIKYSKKVGCKYFDFEGIYDERFPKASRSWKGFTKFKEGFGGTKFIYAPNYTKAIFSNIIF
jgi:lipid II:glycine glycyltransferase (peptidoglycan interpeptide bridge formation enzyme)